MSYADFLFYLNFVFLSLISDFYFVFAPYLYQHLLVDNVTLNNISNNKTELYGCSKV